MGSVSAEHYPGDVTALRAQSLAEEASTSMHPYAAHQK